MLNSIRFKTAIALGVCAAAFATPATAGSANANLGVSATVNANCSVTTNPVAFGAVDTLSASPVLGTGSVEVTCTKNTGWTAAAGIGAGSGATFATRRMTFSGNTLDYMLYRDSARTEIWGDGTSSTFTVAGTGSGAVQSFTVYGRVPGSQTSAPAGAYADTVAITITY